MFVNEGQEVWPMCLARMFEARIQDKLSFEPTLKPEYPGMGCKHHWLRSHPFLLRIQATRALYLSNSERCAAGGARSRHTHDNPSMQRPLRLALNSKGPFRFYARTGRAGCATDPAWKSSFSATHLNAEIRWVLLIRNRRGPLTMALYAGGYCRWFGALALAFAARFSSPAGAHAAGQHGHMRGHANAIYRLHTMHSRHFIQLFRCLGARCRVCRRHWTLASCHRQDWTRRTISGRNRWSGKIVQEGFPGGFSS